MIRRKHALASCLILTACASQATDIARRLRAGERPTRELAGAVLNIEDGKPVPASMLTLSHVVAEERHFLILSRFRNADSTMPRVDSVLAVQPVSFRASHGVAFFFCTRDGVSDRLIVAVVSGERGIASQAWHVDTIENTFRPIAARGIECGDLGV